VLGRVAVDEGPGHFVTVTSGHQVDLEDFVAGPALVDVDYLATAAPADERAEASRLGRC
jgi:hypothetical protein